MITRMRFLRGLTTDTATTQAVHLRNAKATNFGSEVFSRVVLLLQFLGGIIASDRMHNSCP